MSLFEKIIIPLINSELSMKDFKDSTGFVGAYTEDTDRPYLDNHVFLMFKWNKDVPNGVDVFYKFRELNSFHSYKVRYINNEPYIVYTFTSNRDINHLKRGGNFIGESSKQRILQFWMFTDNVVTINVMRGTIASTPTPPLPPEDYIAECNE